MRNPILLLLCFQSLFVSAQIDTVLLHVEASHLYPSLPIKSSYTSLFDRRPGMDYLYAANMEHGLEIYDISQQGVITPVINLPVSTFNNLDVSTIEQRGNALFVGIGDFQITSNTSSGLAILDISNPLNPILKDLWDSTYFSKGVSHLLVDGDYAYLSTMKDGIFIINVADENNIFFVSYLQLDLNYPAPSSPNAHNARGLKIRNDSLYVCFDRGGIRLIDVTDKSNPVEVYKYINLSLNSQAGAAYNDIVLKGNHAYVSVDYCGLEVIDISTIPFSSTQWYNPWGCNFFNWSGAEIHTNEMHLGNGDSLLFVTAGQSDLFVFDVTNPLVTKRIGQLVYVSDTLATHGIDVFNNQIALSFLRTPFHIPPLTPFYADPGGLKILSFDVQNSSTSLDQYNLSDSKLLVYPNPALDSEIILDNPDPILTLTIVDQLGRLVYENQQIHTNFFKLNTSSFPAGVYYLKATTSETIRTQQVVLLR